jgi:hypothetical protein
MFTCFYSSPKVNIYGKGVLKLVLGMHAQLMLRLVKPPTNPCKPLYSTCHTNITCARLAQSNADVVHIWHKTHFAVADACKLPEQMFVRCSKTQPCS